MTTSPRIHDSYTQGNVKYRYADKKFVKKIAFKLYSEKLRSQEKNSGTGTKFQNIAY